jgi:RNA polymerase sigma-70 factor, ECF subfamily
VDFSPFSIYKFISGGCLSSELVNIQSEGPAWFETLYRARGAQLLLYGRALGLSHAEAEDVLQETFIALMDRQSPPTQPEHYCVRAYRNRALNYRRSLWRRITREFESLRWFEVSPDETETERLAMKRLTSLPPDQREVIVLKIWHQYTFEEIGELLEVSPNTAAGRYRYGLQKLRTSLMGVDYEQQQREHTRAQRIERTRSAVRLMDAAAPVAEN